MQSPEKLYRDNVHKDIKWDTLATAIINTPEFQRLDGIKQLGFAELVYRGAKHTRFDHSVGAYWIARQIVQLIPTNHERLGISFPPESEFSERLGSGALFINNLSRIISYAGLLHDITHIPFGHTLEDEFQGIFEYKHDDLESPRLPYILFDQRSGIAQVFKRNEPWIEGLSNNDLVHLLAVIISYKDEVGKPGYEKGLERSFDEILSEKIQNQKNLPKGYPGKVPDAILYYWQDLLTWYLDLKQKLLYHPFMTDIVANTICSDILDYIKRDVFGTGIEMDFDQRVLQYFVIGREIIRGGYSWRLALCIRDTRKGIDKIDIASEVLNILSLRYSLAERVYYHKSKVSAGAMLAKAISLLENPVEPNLEYGTKVDEKVEETSTSVEKHILSVGMTDDGFLCWLDDKADRAIREFVPSLPTVTEKELAIMKNVSSVQLAMATKDGSAIVETDADIDTISPGYRTKTLIQNIRERKLYKPVVIISYDIARRERRLKYFTTNYYDRKRCRVVEKELAQILGIHEGSIVIYCPRAQPQMKQMETRVLIRDLTVQPLWDDDRFKDQANSISRRYERLWKLFVFLDPEKFKNPITRQKVTEEFHRLEKFKNIEARDLAPYPWLEGGQKSAWEEYASHSNLQESQLWHPRLAEFIEDYQYWKQIEDLENGKKVGTKLAVASAILFLYDFEVDQRRVAQSKPSWLGLENVLNNSLLRQRILRNLKWKDDVTAQFVSSNRDRQTTDQAILIRDAYYSVFRKWNDEIDRK